MARDIAREERAVFFQGVLILKSSLYSCFIQDLEAHQQNMFYEVCTFSKVVSIVTLYRKCAREVTS